jgi:DNA ligase (NAD+)
LEWGDKILQKLVDSGMVKDVADLYRLKASDIAGIDRMGERSAKNLITELDKFREISLENFIGGLTIDNVATSTVKLVISAGYSNLDYIYKLSVNDLIKISGFGDIKAKAFYQGLIDNKDRISDILSAGVKIKGKIQGNLSGKIFVFTGSSKTPRAKLIQMVQENGGETKNSVVKGTHFLVIADPSSTSSKAQAAKKMGVKLIDEEEFLKMIE